MMICSQPLFVRIFAALLLSEVGNAAEGIPRWSIRSELLVIEVPQAVGLPIRNHFADDASTAHGVKELNSLIASGRASLIGMATTWNSSEERSLSGTTEDIRNRTEWDPVMGASLFPRASELDTMFADAFIHPISNIEVPRAFQTRTAGITLEVGASAFNEGRAINLSFVAEHVRFLGMRPMLCLDRSNQRFSEPIFRSHKTTAQLSVVSGEWKLVAFHVIAGKAPVFEFMLLRATTIPVKP